MNNDSNTWILKTREGGSDSDDNWQHFLSEAVIACGWPGIELNPADFTTQNAYTQHVKDEFDSVPDWDIEYAARTLYRFCHSIQSGDTVIISKGYVPNQAKPVFLYGIAVVETYVFDLTSTWWRFKRKAVIDIVGKSIPVSAYITAFRKRSLRQTLHGPFDKSMLTTFLDLKDDTQPRIQKLESSAVTAEVLPVQKIRKPIYEALNGHFSLSDLAELCFLSDLADFEELHGETIGEKSISLIKYCEKRGLVDLLIAQIQNMRPNINIMQ